jgi:hypothetical protein
MGVAMKTRLLTSIATVALATSPILSQAATWDVPGDGPQVATILANPSCVAGDEIHVTGSLITTQNPISVTKAVDVRNLTGHTVTVTAASSWAVQISEQATVEGFRLVGGSGSGIAFATGGEFKNCTFEDNGNGYVGGAVPLYAGYPQNGRLTDCTVTLTNTSYPDAVKLVGTGTSIDGCSISSAYVNANGDLPIVELSGASTQMTNCTVTTVDSTSNAYGIYAHGSGCVVQGNTVMGGLRGMLTGSSALTVEENVFHIQGTGGVGIRAASSGTTYFHGNTVHAFNCDTAYGIYLLGSGATHDIQNNLFVNMDYAVFANGGSSSATFDHNIWWAGCGTGSNLTLTSTQMANKEPLFCSAREASVQRFTQRIDSEASPRNNGWGELVGARSVECAWGTLARNTVVPWGAQVIVLEDVTVPSLKSLTFDDGVTMKFDTVDQSASGSDSGDNELIVVGSIEVNGTNGDPVIFESAAGSPAEGDWWGIDIQDAAVEIDYAVIRHSQYGIHVNGQSGGPDHVTDCTFASNQLTDIYIENNATTGLYLDVTDNTLTVGGGDGIHIDDNYTSGLVVDGNTLTCSSSTDDAIYVNSSHADLDITGNIVSGATNGQGINLDLANGFVRANTVTNCKYGIRVAGGGDPTLGPETTGPGNTITSCGTAGILTTGSGTNPLIRFNTSTGNSSGLRCDSSSNPDAGNGSDDGDNDFESNSIYHIRNSTGNTIQAVGNWFGSCPNLPTILGSVNISGQLCTDPTSRGLIATEPVPPGMPVVMVRSLVGSPGVLNFVVDRAARTERLSLSVIDVAGRLVRTFPDLAAADVVTVGWNGKDLRGQDVPSGVYFVRLTSDRERLGATKFVLAR